MTHHEEKFDPDFDAVESTPKAHHPAPHHPVQHDQPEGVTFTLSMTPKKLFIAGFVAGVIVMGIPTAYLYAKGGGSLGSVAAAPTPSPLAPNPSAPPQVGTVKAVSSEDHVRGAKNAKVTLIEYSDLECPFCKRFHPTVQQAMKDYEGKIAWVYRHFPLSFHPEAMPLAVGAECANELGGSDAYWAFSDKIMAE